ncbi:hypothetical protein ACJIZ3_011097 [Penstemon smallii]|uniref:Uncharacterized protein n=1 Tax=Penstemon smallii TaxID=265156 RepID=A0ABD3UIK5_9LAMI
MLLQLVIEDVEKDRRYNVDPSLVGMKFNNAGLLGTRRKEPQHVQVFSQTHIVDFSCLD